MGIIGERPSTKMAGFGSRFQYEESNYMVSEDMEEYVLYDEEAAYKYTGEQVPMGFMDSGGGLHDGNYSHLWD